MTLTEQNGNSEFLTRLLTLALGLVVAGLVMAILWAGASRVVAAVGEMLGRFLK